MFQYSNLVYALLYDYLIFDTSMAFIQLTAVVFILAVTFYVGYLKAKGRL